MLTLDINSRQIKKKLKIKCREKRSKSFTENKINAVAFIWRLNLRVRFQIHSSPTSVDRGPGFTPLHPLIHNAPYSALEGSSAGNNSWIRVECARIKYETGSTEMRTERSRVTYSILIIIRTRKPSALKKFYINPSSNQLNFFAFLVLIRNYGGVGRISRHF